MSDLSTLLLLTCTQCLETTPIAVQRDSYTCTNAEGQSQENLSVEPSSQCISPPEALTQSLESNSPTTKIPQKKPLPLTKITPRPGQPELFANASFGKVSQQSNLDVRNRKSGESEEGKERQGKIFERQNADENSLPLLRFGSQGEAVNRLQTKLKQLGYYSGEVDGVYGLLTRNAVSKFQETERLDIDGIAGTQTWAKLFKPSPKPTLTEKSKEVEIEENPSPKPSSRTPSAAPKQETSPKQPNLGFTGTQPQYLWLWGWVIFVAGGYVVLLKSSDYQLFSAKENKPSVSNEEDKLVSTVQPKSDKTITETSPAEKKELVKPIAETNLVEKKDIPLAQGSYCLLAAKPDSSTYILRQNLTELGEKFFASSPPYPITPFPHSLPLSSDSDDDNLNVCEYVLICDQKGKIYMSETLKNRSDQTSLLVDGNNIWNYIFAQEALPALPLESIPRLLFPSWVFSNFSQTIEDISKNSPPPINQSIREQTTQKDSVELEDKATSPANPPETIEKESVESEDKTSSPANPLEEKSSSTTLVGTLPTADQKTGETYIYSLIEDAGGLFMLKGNKLLLLNKALPDTETDSTYDIKLRRTNNQGLSVDKAFKVAVK